MARGDSTCHVHGPAEPARRLVIHACWPPGDASRYAARVPAQRVSRAPVVVVIGFFAIALVLVLIGAAAAERAAAGGRDRPGGHAAPTPRDVTVIMRDYRFDPTPVVLVPGETVRLTILNGGLVEHELTLGERRRPGGLGTRRCGGDPAGPVRDPATRERAARDRRPARPARVG